MRSRDLDLSFISSEGISDAIGVMVDIDKGFFDPSAFADVEPVMKQRPAIDGNKAFGYRIRQRLKPCSKTGSQKESLHRLSHRKGMILKMGSFNSLVLLA